MARRHASEQTTAPLLCSIIHFIQHLGEVENLLRNAKYNFHLTILSLLIISSDRCSSEI